MGDSVREIHETGANYLEISYNLPLYEAKPLLNALHTFNMKVSSVHNFCPVPPVCLTGGPELFSLSALQESERRKAVFHTSESIRFTAETGANILVIHCGNIQMPKYTNKLITRILRPKRGFIESIAALFKAKQRYSVIPHHSNLRQQNVPAPRDSALMEKAMRVRSKKAGKHLDSLYRSIDDLQPILKKNGVKLALENLPSLEAIPSPAEFLSIVARFGKETIAYWHDTGHAEIMENLGFINHKKLLNQMKPHLAGCHIHDVIFPSFDHMLPGIGTIDFSMFRDYYLKGLPMVLETNPSATSKDMSECLQKLKNTWETPPEQRPQQR